jgi:hypothetical protein
MVRPVLLTLVAAALLGLPTPGRSAAPAPSGSAGAAPKARFSAANAYTGAPDLALTLSMVTAGGGPGSFDSKKLIGVLAGDKTQAEVQSLSLKFGPDNVASFLKVFDFVVNDALRLAQQGGVALPSTPNPDPKDGKALAAALYQRGVVPGGNFDVEYMLDGLVSHPIHVQVMNDIDAKFGAPADGNYHAVLTQAMMDLKALYGL